MTKPRVFLGPGKKANASSQCWGKLGSAPVPALRAMGLACEESPQAAAVPGAALELGQKNVNFFLIQLIMR